MIDKIQSLKNAESILVEAFFYIKESGEAKKFTEDFNKIFKNINNSILKHQNKRGRPYKVKIKN